MAEDNKNMVSATYCESATVQGSSKAIAKLDAAFVEVQRILSEMFPGYFTGEHHVGTPQRLARALYCDYFWGCREDAQQALGTAFDSTVDQMIFIAHIPFDSFCAHHWVPFIGEVHFAYLPHGCIIGLSKIPRMIDVLSHRPQVQEDLTEAIVDTFISAMPKDKTPSGAGVVVQAEHFCMSIRGPKKRGAVTTTQALRGNFLTNATIRQEFFDGIRRR